MPGNYAIVINIYGNGKGEYTYEKILCYVFASYSHPTAAIPVYQYVTGCYTSGPYGDWREVPHYEIDWDRFKQGTEHTKYKGILCYIYPTDFNGENLVNLYFGFYSITGLRPPKGEPALRITALILTDDPEALMFVGKGVTVKPVN